MPTYSYRCTECGNAFDIQQAFTDDTLTECPVCGGKLRKIFSAVGVTFNGSGFYRTDSRAKPNEGGSGDKGGSDKGGSEKGGSEKSGGEKKGESAGSSGSPAKESKPASPSPSKPARSGSSGGGSTPAS